MKHFLRPSIRLWATFNLIAAISVTLIPAQLFFGNSVWLLSANHLSFLMGIFLAYSVGIIIIVTRLQRRDTLSLFHVMLILLAAFGAFSVWVLMTKSFYSRPLLLITILLSTSFIFLSFRLNRSTQKLLIPIIVVLTIVLQLLGNSPTEILKQARGSDIKPSRTEKLIDTAFYSIRAIFYDKHICGLADKLCTSPRNGGGLSLLGTGYLLATGDGRLYSVTHEVDNKVLNSHLLPHRIPINSADFLKDGHADDLWLFRVTDILVQQKEDSVRLFAAHHYWKADKKCFVLRVSSLEGTVSAVMSGDSSLNWQTVYETAPCLNLQAPLPGSHSSRLFSGDESGGRLISLGENKLLLSVGDHLFNGYDREEMFAQDATSSYGKTVLLDLATGESSIYSRGHRNPQGLYLDPKGVIWETEHGPRGGDELNVIQQDKNYGWPLVTYGTDYGKHTWPLNPKQGEHDGFQRSLYSWVPSTATSNLIGIEGPLFKLWKHDLLVSSYKKTIWRVRIREGRVSYAEPIKIRDKNARIRDSLEDNDGRIVLWLDSGSIVFLEPNIEIAEAQIGQDSPQQIYFSKCGGCHALDSNSSAGIGPSLSHVVNRDIASVTGYDYSEALTSLSGIWTVERLNVFIENPKVFAPRTTMDFHGIPDPDERASLIDYLETTGK